MLPLCCHDGSLTQTPDVRCGGGFRDVERVTPDSVSHLRRVAHGATSDL